MNRLTTEEASLRVTSKLTERSQTTIPASVRDALKLKPGEHIEYALLPGGQVLMTRKEIESDEDPVIANFLSFLADDMQNNPSRIQPLGGDLMARARALTEGMDIDLDAPL